MTSPPSADIKYDARERPRPNPTRPAPGARMLQARERHLRPQSRAATLGQTGRASGTSHLCGDVLVWPDAGAHALVERVAGQVRAARPDDGSGLHVGASLSEPVGCASTFEHWAVHPGEHVDLASEAVSERELQDAVTDDRDGGNGKRWKAHCRGSIALSVPPTSLVASSRAARLGEARPRRARAAAGAF